MLLEVLASYIFCSKSFFLDILETKGGFPRNFYVRTHVQITHEWKSTLRKTSKSPISFSLFYVQSAKQKLTLFSFLTDAL